MKWTVTWKRTEACYYVCEEKESLLVTTSEIFFS